MRFYIIFRMTTYLSIVIPKADSIVIAPVVLDKELQSELKKHGVNLRLLFNKIKLTVDNNDTRHLKNIAKSNPKTISEPKIQTDDAIADYNTDHFFRGKGDGKESVELLYISSANSRFLCYKIFKKDGTTDIMPLPKEATKAIMEHAFNTQEYDENAPTPREMAIKKIPQTEKYTASFLPDKISAHTPIEASELNKDYFSSHVQDLANIKSNPEQLKEILANNSQLGFSGVINPDKPKDKQNQKKDHLKGRKISLKDFGKNLKQYTHLHVSLIPAIAVSTIAMLALLPTLVYQVSTIMREGNFSAKNIAKIALLALVTVLSFALGSISTVTYGTALARNYLNSERNQSSEVIYSEFEIIDPDLEPSKPELAYTEEREKFNTLLKSIGKYVKLQQKESLSPEGFALSRSGNQKREVNIEELPPSVQKFINGLPIPSDNIHEVINCFIEDSLLSAQDRSLPKTRKILSSLNITLIDVIKTIRTVDMPKLVEDMQTFIQEHKEKGNKPSIDSATNFKAIDPDQHEDSIALQ